MEICFGTLYNQPSDRALPMWSAPCTTLVVYNIYYIVGYSSTAELNNKSDI